MRRIDDRINFNLIYWCQHKLTKIMQFGLAPELFELNEAKQS